MKKMWKNAELEELTIKATMQDTDKKGTSDLWVEDAYVDPNTGETRGAWIEGGPTASGVKDNVDYYH